MPSKSSKKKAKKTGSSVFDMFSQRQVAEFKEGFQMMDKDHDGIIGKTDIQSTCDEVGRLTNDSEIDSMLGDCDGPITFTSLVHMFGSRSQGETDDDEVIVKAFRTFESSPGVIDADRFRSLLMAFGDRFTSKEVDDAFEQLELTDDGNVNSNAAIAMLVGSAKKAEAE